MLAPPPNQQRLRPTAPPGDVRSPMRAIRPDQLAGGRSADRYTLGSAPLSGEEEPLWSRGAVADGELDWDAEFPSQAAGARVVKRLAIVTVLAALVVFGLWWWRGGLEPTTPFPVAPAEASGSAPDEASEDPSLETPAEAAGAPEAAPEAAPDPEATEAERAQDPPAASEPAQARGEGQEAPPSAGADPRPAQTAPAGSGRRGGVDDYDAAMVRAEREFSARRYGAAMDLFERIAERHPRAEPHVGVARCYAALGQHHAAARRFERALAENERYLPAWEGLAQSSQAAGLFEQAFRAWQTLAERSPDPGQRARAERAMGTLRR
jgi:hypothetical protein